MAIAYLQTVHTGSNSDVSTLTTGAYASAVGAGNLIVVGVSNYSKGATNVSSVTDSKGNTYTRITGVAEGSGCTIELWYAYNVTGGTSFTITVNYSVACRGNVIAQEFSGISTANPLDKSSALDSNPNSSTTYTSNATATTTIANELVVGFVEDDSGANNYTAGSGYSNLVQDQNGGTFSAMESKVVSTTGAQTATVTVTSGHIFCFLVATFQGTTSISVSDTLTTSESTTVLNANLAVAVSDSLTLSESVTPFEVVLYVNTSDTLTFSELITFTPLFPFVNDRLALTESVTLTLGTFIPLVFNGTDLNQNGIAITALHIHDRPKRNIQNLKLARVDGSKLLNAEYAEKQIVVDGFIAGADRPTYETLRDTLMAQLRAQEATLQFAQSNMLRNYTCTVSSVAFSNTAGGFGTFQITFIASTPFGLDTSVTTALNASGITASSSTQILTAIGGSMPAQPTITITISALTGGTSKLVKITNPFNSKAITVTRTWTAGDVLVIDCAGQTCKVNGTLVDYTGVFPTWSVLDTTLKYDDTLTTRTTAITFTYFKRYL